jgi:multidrug resistance efflux pump
MYKNLNAAALKATLKTLEAKIDALEAKCARLNAIRECWHEQETREKAAAEFKIAWAELRETYARLNELEA